MANLMLSLGGLMGKVEILMGIPWNRVGTAGGGHYHLWWGWDQKNRQYIYRATRKDPEALTRYSGTRYPKGNFGYPSKAILLKLLGVKEDL
jgi:hypothetical protein